MNEKPLWKQVIYFFKLQSILGKDQTTAAIGRLVSMPNISGICTPDVIPGGFHRNLLTGFRVG